MGSTPAPRDFNVGLRSGILDPKHYKTMGIALWTFVWALDRQTGDHGLIHNGDPLTYALIAEEAGVPSPDVARAHVEKLISGGYLERTFVYNRGACVGFSLRVVAPKRTYQKDTTSPGKHHHLPRKTPPPPQENTTTSPPEQGEGGGVNRGEGGGEDRGGIRNIDSEDRLRRQTQKNTPLPPQTPSAETKPTDQEGIAAAIPPAGQSEGLGHTNGQPDTPPPQEPVAPPPPRIPVWLAEVGSEPLPPWVAQQEKFEAILEREIPAAAVAKVHRWITTDWTVNPERRALFTGLMMTINREAVVEWAHETKERIKAKDRFLTPRTALESLDMIATRQAIEHAEGLR